MMISTKHNLFSKTCIFNSIIHSLKLFDNQHKHQHKHQHININVNINNIFNMIIAIKKTTEYYFSFTSHQFQSKCDKNHASIIFFI